MMVFASCYYVLFCCVWLVPLRTLFFSYERHKGRWIWKGRRDFEELGGIEGRGIIIAKSWIRKEYIFNKRQTKKFLKSKTKQKKMMGFQVLPHYQIVPEVHEKAAQQSYPVTVRSSLLLNTREALA